MTRPFRVPCSLPASLLALTLAGVPFSPFLKAQSAAGGPGISQGALPAASSSFEAESSFRSSTPLEPSFEPSSGQPTLALPTPAAVPVTDRPNRAYKPFSAFAVAVKGGFAGIGFDLATPLAQRFNLRGGASFFQYNGNYNVDGTTILGEAKFRSVNMSLDWFPFNNRFRVSPGIILYNGNNLNATASVPGGQTFTLEDATYTSSPGDPVHGSANLTFGNKVAPSLTVGAGNMIPRHGSGHFSIPFEIGFEYITSPLFHLDLQGTACQQGICQSTSLPQFQQNLRNEEAEVNADIAPLRVYPIVSIGLGYKF